MYGFGIIWTDFVCTSHCLKQSYRLFCLNSIALFYSTVSDTNLLMPSLFLAENWAYGVKVDAKGISIVTISSSVANCCSFFTNNVWLCTCLLFTLIYVSAWLNNTHSLVEFQNVKSQDMVFVFVYVCLSCQDLIMYKYVLQLPRYLCSTGIYMCVCVLDCSTFTWEKQGASLLFSSSLYVVVLPR